MLDQVGARPWLPSRVDERIEFCAGRASERSAARLAGAGFVRHRAALPGRSGDGKAEERSETGLTVKAAEFDAVTMLCAAEI